MRRLAIAVVVFMAVPAQAEEPDAFTMTIDAGRLGVMMDQSQRMLSLPDDPTAENGSTETPVVLRNAVKQYQRLLHVACARHAVANEICDKAYYNPAWLSDTKAPALSVLRTRIDEATEYVSPLWGALCDRLPKEHDESLCQME